MSSLPEVLGGFVTALNGLKPGTVKTVLDHVREQPFAASELPAVMLDPQAPRVYARNQQRQVVWPVDLIVLVCLRSADIGADLAAAYPLPEAIIAALDTHLSLNDTSRALQWGEPVLGGATGAFEPFQMRDKNYIAFTVHAIPSWKQNVTFSR